VTHDDEQRRVQVFGRVLDARKDGIVGDVARDADGKQVTETLIEDDFGWHPRVGAAQDHGVRVLATDEAPVTCWRFVRVSILVLDVVPVTFLQLRKRCFRRRSLRLREREPTVNPTRKRDEHRHRPQHR
jgi:hypothetical protein